MVEFNNKFCREEGVEERELLACLMHIYDFIKRLFDVHAVLMKVSDIWNNGEKREGSDVIVTLDEIAAGRWSAIDGMPYDTKTM